MLSCYGRGANRWKIAGFTQHPKISATSKSFGKIQNIGNRKKYWQHLNIQ